MDVSNNAGLEEARAAEERKVAEIKQREEVLRRVCRPEALERREWKRAVSAGAAARRLRAREPASQDARRLTRITRLEFARARAVWPRIGERDCGIAAGGRRRRGSQ